MKKTINVKEKLNTNYYVIVYSSVKPQNGGEKIV